MNNQTIIDQLSRTELISVCELLVNCLKMKDDLWDIADWVMFSELPDDVIDYCDKLTSHERLKFLALIINTQVLEEESAAGTRQIELPVG